MTVSELVDGEWVAAHQPSRRGRPPGRHAGRDEPHPVHPGRDAPPGPVPGLPARPLRGPPAAAAAALPHRPVRAGRAVAARAPSVPCARTSRPPTDRSPTRSAGPARPPRSPLPDDWDLHDLALPAARRRDTHVGPAAARRRPARRRPGRRRTPRGGERGGGDATPAGARPRRSRAAGTLRGGPRRARRSAHAVRPAPRVGPPPRRRAPRGRHRSPAPGRRGLGRPAHRRRAPSGDDLRRSRRLLPTSCPSWSATAPTPRPGCRALLPRATRMDELAGDITRLEAERADAETDLAMVQARQREAPEAITGLEARCDAAAAAGAAREGAALRLAAADERVRAQRESLEVAAALASSRVARQVACEAAQDLREHWLTIREARLEGMAAEIAGALAVGACCPVCGSADHPAKALPTPGAPDADGGAGRPEGRGRRQGHRAPPRRRGARPRGATGPASGRRRRRRPRRADRASGTRSPRRPSGSRHSRTAPTRLLARWPRPSRRNAPMPLPRSACPPGSRSSASRSGRRSPSGSA